MLALVPVDSVQEPLDEVDQLARRLLTLFTSVCFAGLFHTEIMIGPDPDVNPIFA